MIAAMKKPAGCASSARLTGFSTRITKRPELLFNSITTLSNCNNAQNGHLQGLWGVPASSVGKYCGDELALFVRPAVA